MQRCFDLARLGAGFASPNPMVGAVIAHNDTIIGEGFFARDGGPHAEVMAVRSVREEHRSLLKHSTLYVSLEPCNIHGRTPPCTDLILETGIPHVVVAARDLTPGVNGSGLARLRKQGVLVEEAVLSENGKILSQYRNTYVSQHRPYILLKYAQTANGFMAPVGSSQHWLTNPYSKRLVHKWRTETDAILIGNRTARIDNPALTARLYPGPQPRRIVLDRHANLPLNMKLFDGQTETIAFSQTPRETANNATYMTHDFTNAEWLPELLKKIADKKIAHLTVEGGAWLLQTIVQQNLWDEARVFTTTHYWKDGLPAPTLTKQPAKVFSLQNDRLTVHYNF